MITFVILVSYSLCALIDSPQQQKSIFLKNKKFKTKSIIFRSFEKESKTIYWQQQGLIDKQKMKKFELFLSFGKYEQELVGKQPLIQLFYFKIIKERSSRWIFTDLLPQIQYLCFLNSSIQNNSQYSNMSSVSLQKRTISHQNSSQVSSRNDEDQQENEKKKKQSCYGHWTPEENMKYIAFLYKHKLRFACKLKNKKIRLFQEMANFIGTRTTIQCRTHHQKFQLKLGSTKGILQSYKQQVGQDIFKMVVKNQNLEHLLQNYSTGIQTKQNRNKQNSQTRTRDVGVQTDSLDEMPEQCTVNMPQTWCDFTNNIVILPIFYY